MQIPDSHVVSESMQRPQFVADTPANFNHNNNKNNSNNSKANARKCNNRPSKMRVSMSTLSPESLNVCTTHTLAGGVCKRRGCVQGSLRSQVFHSTMCMANMCGGRESAKIGNNNKMLPEKRSKMQTKYTDGECIYTAPDGG